MEHVHFQARGVIRPNQPMALQPLGSTLTEPKRLEGSTQHLLLSPWAQLFRFQSVAQNEWLCHHDISWYVTNAFLQKSFNVAHQPF